MRIRQLPKTQRASKFNFRMTLQPAGKPIFHVNIVCGDPDHLVATTFVHRLGGQADDGLGQNFMRRAGEGN